MCTFAMGRDPTGTAHTLFRHGMGEGMEGKTFPKAKWGRDRPTSFPIPPR